MNRDFDVELLYRALNKERKAKGLTWAGVAKEIESRYTKVSPSTIKGVRDKQFIEGDGGLQMMLWLGRSPESFVPGFNAGRNHELVEPKKGVLRFDVKETYRLLDARRLNEGFSWIEVADQIGGFSPAGLRRFKKGGRTSFPGIIRIARWLDVPTKQLTRENPW